MPRSPDVQELIRRMKVSNETCVTREIDLTAYKFRSSDSAMWLEPIGSQMGVDKLYFRFDPSDPKDADIHLARDQFCRVLKIPTAFFRDNRPALQETFVRNWVSALTPGDSKSVFQLRLREGSQMTVVRAFLKKEETDMPHYRVLSSLLAETEDPIDLVVSTGDTQDCRILEAKFLVGPEFPIAGEPYRLGLYVQASELGVTNLIVDAFLYHLPSDSTFVITFERDSMLSLGYNGTQPKDMEALLSDVLPSLFALQTDVVQRVESAFSAGFSGVQETAAHFSSFLPKDVMQKVRREIESAYHVVGEDGEDTDLQDQDHPWWGNKGFTIGLAGVANGLSQGKKVLLEKQAGYLLDLKFRKK